nr:hypothetical protein [Tanacetum cinerariifolium]
MKKEPTLSLVVDIDEGTKNYSFNHIFVGFNSSVLVDKTKSDVDGLKITHTDSDFLNETRYAFFTPDSPQDDPIIVIDESKEEKADKDDTHATSYDVPEDTSVPPPPSLKLAQIHELMAQVTQTLDRFAIMVENASRATTKDVLSAGQATASPAEGEKNTKDAKTKLKDELVDLLGTNVVTRYYNKKLLFDKYYDKMLKRKKAIRSQTVKFSQRKALSR